MRTPLASYRPATAPIALGIKIRSTRIENKSFSHGRGTLARSLALPRRNSLIEFRRGGPAICPDDTYYFRREKEKGAKGAEGGAGWKRHRDSTARQ